MELDMKLQISIPLIVSAALNLVLIGFLLGDGARQFTAHRFGPPPLPPMPFLASPEWLASLPDEKSAKVRKTFEQIMRDREAEFSEIKETHGKLRNLIAAEPFDERALRAALDELALEREATFQHVTNQLIALLRELSPEERAAFARGMDRPIPFGGPAMLMHKRSLHRGGLPAKAHPEMLPHGFPEEER
jgi:uncharacterized membrane protein